MPHATLSYSSDLQLDAGAMLRDIEETILAHDAGAGACKGRAYSASVFHHSHIMIDIALLDKPHRDAAFMAALARDLEARIKVHLLSPCAFSMEVRFSGSQYVTNMHQA